mgnify:CR=1 FL=1
MNVSTTLRAKSIGYNCMMELSTRSSICIRKDIFTNTPPKNGDTSGYGAAGMTPQMDPNAMMNMGGMQMGMNPQMMNMGGMQMGAMGMRSSSMMEPGAKSRISEIDLLVRPSSTVTFRGTG